MFQTISDALSGFLEKQLTKLFTFLSSTLGAWVMGYLDAFQLGYPEKVFFTVIFTSFAFWTLCLFRWFYLSFKENEYKKRMNEMTDLAISLGNTTSKQSEVIHSQIKEKQGFSVFPF